MKGSLFFILFYLFTAAWAGGYQSCFERVWLYQAYLIDQLNDEADRTIGYQCKGNDWDEKTKTCKNWKPMPGKGKLNYDVKALPEYLDPDSDLSQQFVHALGGARDRTGWAVLDGDNLDIEKTALQTYTKYTTPGPGQAAGKAKANSFAARLVVRDTHEWNQCIMKVGEVVDKTWKTKLASLSDSQKALFAEFDKATEFVSKARAGDHGKYVIEEAKRNTKLTGYDIKEQDLGLKNQAGAAYKTVDWAATYEAAVSSGKKDPLNTLAEFLTGWYGNGASGDAQASAHKQVMMSYKKIKDYQRACGR